MIQLNAHFHRDPSLRHSEWLQDQRWFIKARDHQRKQQEQSKAREERLDDDLDAFTAAITFASAAQIDTFRITLDTYDTATVEALEANRIQMEVMRERMDALLDRAYVMEDGRRVFKTEDGAQVFDEFGTEVTPKELDYDLIGPDRPYWQSYQPDLEAFEALRQERTTILEYQDHLDNARERINEGEITEDELSNLQTDLDNVMPDVVRRQMPDYVPEQTAAATTTAPVSLAQGQTFTPMQ